MQEQSPHLITIIAAAAGVVLTALGAKFWDNIKEVILAFFGLFGKRRSKDLEYVRNKNVILTEKLHQGEITLNIKQERIIELEKSLFEMSSNFSVVVFAIQESDDIGQIRKFAERFNPESINITSAET